MVDIGIVIVTFNTKELTLRCLRSIFDKKWKVSIEVWVLDNGSDDTYGAIKTKFPKVKIFKENRNLGFSGGNNLLIKKAYKSSKYVLLLNSDTEVLKDSLDKLFEESTQNDFDISSCYLVQPNELQQPNCGDLPTPLPTLFWLSGLDGLIDKIALIPSYHQDNKNYYQNTREVGWVSGSVMLIKQKVFNTIGFLDEKIFMYGEDVDFCFRAKHKKFKIGWVKNAKIIHIGGASSKSPKFVQWKGEFSGLLYLYKKFYGPLSSLILRLSFYIFLVLRIILYSLLAKYDYAKTYAKITVSI